jgi:hypothetical protein
MKNFEIWSEGFRATGEWGTATYHGSCEGDSFKQVCILFATHNLNFAKYFDPDRMTFWGCKLFDNEYDARNRFG